MKNKLLLAIPIVLCFLACSGSEGLSPKQFESYILTAKDIRVIDMRSPEEFAKGHIKGAENIPISDTAAFSRAIDDDDNNAPYALYCRSGVRSSKAASIISKKAKAVYTLKGGITQWEKAGLPIVIPEK